MAERPLYTLYKNLKAQNYDVPDDYNKFESALTRDGKSGADNRHAIYENLKAQNFDVPDTYERFYSALFVPRSRTSSRAKGGSVPMSAADRARYLSVTQSVLNTARQVKRASGNIRKTVERAKKFNANDGNVAIGFKNPLQNKNVQKNKFNYNSTTGKTGTYTTTDGVEFDNEYDAAQYQNQLDKYGEEWNNAVDMGIVPSELDKADPDLSDTDVAMRQMERRQEWINENQDRRSKELNESMHLQGSPFVASGGAVAPSSFNTAISNEANRLSDVEYGAYNTAKAYNQMLRTTLLQELKEQKQRNENAGWWKDKWNDVSNYFGAMFNTMLDPKLYSKGVMDVAISNNLLQVKKGMEDGTIKKGSNARNAAKAMLGAIQQQQVEAAKQQQYGTKAYQYGDVSGRSLKFMGDFALSGWRDVMTTGFTKAGEKVGEKMALGALGKWFTKNTGRVLGDMAGSAALAATNQLGSTYNNVIERYVGINNENGGVTQDKNGDLKFNEGVSLGKAIKDGFGSATIENFSEMFGEYLPGASKLLSKLGLSKVSSFFEKIGNNAYYKWLSNATNKSGIQGVMSEIAEEEFGTALHAAWGDGDGSWSDFNVFTNPDAREKQIDTCLGMFYSVGFMQSPRTAVGAINAVKYFNIKHQVTKADKFGQMMFGDNWDEIKNKIDVTTNADLTKTVLDATRSDSMNAKQKGAVINYAMFLSKLRGFNQASDSKTKDKVEEGEIAPTLSNDLDDAYTEGHNADDADKHDIQIQHEDQAKTLAAALNISEQQLSGMSDEELESLTGQDDKLDQAIYDYQLSSARYQGVVDDAQDKVDLAAHQAEQRVDMYTDKSRGSVRNATIKASGGLEDYDVYIISGNIATHDDGSIDVSNSDDMILYYDPTTNSVEHADALMFAELGEELPADDVKAQAVADAKENAIKEVAGIIDGTVDVGSQFSVTDSDGTEHTYEVLADNGDGTAMITIDGNVPTELVNGENVQIPYSFSDLQQMKDLEDQKRLEAAKTEREQMEKERDAQQIQETEQTQPSFDFNQILNDNGNVVLVDVLGKDGNTKYPGSKLFLIRDAGSKAKVVEMKSDGTIVPHAVNKEDVATISSMSLDEYKQAMSESLMIEDNSGENRGEIEVESPTIEDETTPEVAENTETTTPADDTTETPATEQTPAAPAITLEDGTIVPMLDDGNPDFSKLTASQTAELYDTEFGEDAYSIVSGYVSDAKKALEKANNMTVKGKTFVEQKASKDAKEKAISDAQAAYDSAIAIRDAYNERQLAKVEDTAEGRKNLIEKARRKFARLKSSVKDDAEAVAHIYKETVGSLLHRLYDSTGIDVTDTTPLTAEEYVASNLGAHSLNYEGTETSKGVKQETGLSREDFAKTQLLAADGKGTTIDSLVHSLWENRSSNLDSLDTQDIRNALIGVLTSGFKASEARSYVENIRIAQAEKLIEEERTAAENAAYYEQQKAKEEEEKKKAELDKKAEEEKEKAELDGEKINPLAERITETDEEVESDGKHGTIYNKVYLIDGDKRVTKVDEPDAKGNYTGSYYMYDGKRFGDLFEVADYIDGKAEEKKSPDKLQDGSKAIEVPEDATDEKPLGEQLDDTDLPFSAKDNGKQQTSSERASDVEKNKVDDMKVVDNIVGKKTRKTLEKLAKMMGANVQWQYSDKNANGWFDDKTNTIYLTLDSSITEGVQFIFGHEMTHEIKTKNPVAYEELKTIVKDMMGEDEFNSETDRITSLYNENNVFYNGGRTAYEEEVVADQLGKWIRDANYAHTLLLKMSHPLLAKLHEIVNRFLMTLHGIEISDDMNLILRSIEQAYVKTANREAIDAATQEGEGGQRLSLRTKPEPKKTQKVYKLMRLGEDGKLYPLFIGSGEAIELGKWYDADSPKLQDLTSLSSKDYVGTRTVKKDGASVKEEYHYGAYIVNNKTGEAMSLADFKAKYSKQFARIGNNPNKKAVDWATDNGYRWIKIEEKNQGQSRYGGEARSYYNYGINGSGSVSIFAMRPGWHAGSLPTMRQIGKGSAKNLRDDTFVWVEGEIPAEIDYNEEAQKNADKDIPDHIPTDGYYLKATNANKEASQADKVGWYVAGSFRANRIMSDKETRDIIDDWNAAHPDDNVEYDWKRESGKDFNAETMSLEDTPKFSLKVYHGSGADFTEFDFDHMGEGAGSQVFGWGGYVTSSKKIGKSYAEVGQQSAESRHAYSEDTPIEAAVGSILGQDMYNHQAKTFEQKKAQAIKNAENSIASFSDMLKNSNELDEKGKKFLEKSIEKDKKELEVLRALTEEQYKEEYIKQGRAKNLYEVDIPDDNGSNYLDWENPLNDEQINSIRDALIKKGVDVSSWEKRGFKLDLPFKNVYAAVLPMMMRCEPKKVSKFLSSLGFTGIKYPAGTIMGGVEGDETNYVIFKPEDMKITEHTKFSIKTYHGSQASFDKFDHSFMGSGEGAQAYGWGTYVSEVEGIAKAYAKQNTAKRNTEYTVAKRAYEDAETEYKNLTNYIADSELNITMYNIPSLENNKKKLAMYKEKGIQHWVEVYEQRVERGKKNIKEERERIEEYKLKQKESYQLMKEAKKKLDSIEKPKRNLYSVDIPDDTGDNYIGWDEPLTEKMYDAEIKILESVGYKVNSMNEYGTLLDNTKNGGTLMIPSRENQTGGSFYKGMAEKLGSQKAASLALKNFGFVGVKVIADRTTGGNKEGKMNYVIFDENNAQITNHTKFSLRLKSAIEETETNPSDAQKESGNYKKGHIKFGGYDYTIENPKGSTRSGKGADGKEWKITMHDTYGYIRGKFGKDGDHLDMFINDKEDLDNWNGDVFVVDQVNPDGSFDEHKVMYGYDSMDDAEKAYLANYSKGWKGLGNITGASKDEFDKWLDTSNRKIKPFADYAKVKFSQAQSVAEPRFSLKYEKTMFGMHNISIDKLRKAIKQGGFAAPSMGVIDSKNGIYSGYGEITLIPKAEKIAKRTGKNIGTYAADAWTPIYPPVEKKFGGNGGDVAYDDIESVPKEMQRLTRNAINSFMDGREANELAYLYLQEKGKAPELVYVEGKYPKELHDEVKGILGKLNGIYNTTDEQKEKLLDLFIREVYDGNKEEFDNDIKKIIKKDEDLIKKRPNSNIAKNTQLDVDWMKEHGYDYGALSRFVDGILRDAETSGKVDENATMKAAQQYIQDKGMKEDFDSWKEKLNDRYNVEEVIFAGYKPDGNRKYLPNTVENAVKVMKQDGKNASVGSASFSHFVASILKPMGTLDQIRKKKVNLTGNYEYVEKFQEKWQPVYDELSDKMQPDAEPFESYGMDRLEEVATQKNPKKYAKEEYGVDLTDEDINKLNELIEAVKNDKPSIYFETKFMRPYGLDEFEKAIVPNDTPSDVVDALKNAGIDVSSYERGNAEDRQKVTMDAINSSDNIRFSLRYDQFEHDLNRWKKDNNLPKDAQRPTIPQRNAGESAVDFLRRVDEYRKQMALWKTAPTYEQHLLSDDTALGEFNRELQRGSVLKRIAFQDSMLAIRKAQEAIMKEVGVDRLNMAEDAYTAENRSHGKGKNEFDEYNNEFLQPLRKAYHQMKKVLGDSYDNVRIYMMAKHGLERDAQMAFKKSLDADYEDVAQRSAAYRAYKGDMNRITNDSDLEFGRVDFNTWRQRDNALRSKYSPSYMDYRYDKNGIVYDYSGLSALFDGSDFEEAAYKLVKDIEDKYVNETHDLWDATNAATKKILRDGYKAGMMSKDTYQYVRDMYSHYIPLRGWDGTTADQVWDYIGGGKGAFNQTLKTAHGRTSIADDPIAYIENMAESGILLNNKNWVKQHLMLLAQNHPTSLLTMSKAWYVKSTDANGNEEWIPATPQITSQMNSNQVKAAIDAFEKKMEQMAQTGDATQKRDGLNIAYPQTHSEEREHEVRVMKDGEEYVIYVNGDPQLAQAMNNTRAHRVSEGIKNSISKRVIAVVGRKMAAAYTSLSPLFIPSNYFRDLTMTLASTAIREDAKYNYLLRKNLATSWNLGFMLRDYQSGKLREKVSNGNATPKEQMFYDFMMNGGETGFVSSLEVEDLKKKFKNDLKDLDRWKANPVKVGHTIMDSIEFLNRAIEDSNRFAVYMTSIQYGRSIDEAVNDAKNVTLNFNRKGTGEHSWQTIRNLYLFINPAVQSLQTLGALAKHHPFKFTAVTASWLASGVLVPIVNAALMQMAAAFGGGDGDDDKEWYKDISNKYWQFSKWDRRNNFIMWVPFTHEFIKIPLAQEFRAFYGVGDMIASKMMGGELAEQSWEDYGWDLLGQVVDMLPLDPTGYDGNILVSICPNVIRPIAELAFNVDFTGKPLFKDTEYNKYDPNFTKAYVGTPDWLVRASRMMNSIGNDYPDVQQNKWDTLGNPRFSINNPAVVDHVLSSYLGGAYTMGSQVLGLLTKSLNDPKEIKVADIPLFSKFVSNPDDRPVTKKQGDEFWNMKENHDRAANTLSKLKKQAKVDGDYSMLERFYGSEEYKQYKQDDVKVKKYEEDKKKERAEESGEEYRPHKLNAEDIYKAHATPKDDFEDLKLKQLYTKLNGFKISYNLLVDTAPSQSDGYYNTNKAAIDAIDEISLDKQEISELKKGFLDDGKDAYNAEDMKQIRELRKKILAVLEKANKVVVANQKANAKKK